MADGVQLNKWNFSPLMTASRVGLVHACNAHGVLSSTRLFFYKMIAGCGLMFLLYADYILLVGHGVRGGRERPCARFRRGTLSRHRRRADTCW
jgi:hypothetical protein